MNDARNLDEEVSGVIEAVLSLSLYLGEGLSLDLSDVDDTFVNVTALIFEVITDLVLVKLIGAGLSYLIVDTIVLLIAV